MGAAVQCYCAGHLTSNAEPASQAARMTSQPVPDSQVTAAAIAITGDGEPCPGVALRSRVPAALYPLQSPPLGPLYCLCRHPAKPGLHAEVSHASSAVAPPDPPY